MLRPVKDGLLQLILEAFPNIQPDEGNSTTGLLHLGPSPPGKHERMSERTSRERKICGHPFCTLGPEGGDLKRLSRCVDCWPEREESKTSIQRPSTTRVCSRPVWNRGAKLISAKTDSLWPIGQGQISRGRDAILGASYPGSAWARPWPQGCGSSGARP